MAWRDVFPWLKRKASKVTAAIVAVVWPRQAVYPKTNFHSLAKNGFEGNIYVYRAVMTIAQACAGIPWRLYQKPRSRGAKPREIEDHPLLKLWNRPNPEQGGTRFRRDLVAYLILAGNAYIEAVRPTTRVAPPLELWLLRPDRVKVIADPKNRIGGYEYSVGSYRETFAPEDVLHLRMFAATDDWYGLSPVAVAMKVVAMQNSGEEWNTALLQNFGRPPFVLLYKGTDGSAYMDDEQFERLKRELREEWGGPENAGIPKLLEGDMEVVQLGMRPTDVDWVQGDMQAGRKIAIALGVPPELLGDSSQKTYSNYKEARQSFYTETVLPLMDELRDEFNNWLVPMYDDRLYLDYDRDEIEALQDDRKAIVERLKEAWWLSLNERRQAMGYDPVEGGDEVLIPGNLTPLSVLSGADMTEPFGPSPQAQTANESKPDDGQDGANEPDGDKGDA